MRQLLANVLQELGDARGGVGIANIGDTKGALAAYREALGLREALRRERPADLEARTGLANVRLMLGSLAWSLRDTSGAASIREGVSLLEGVVADAPDDAVHRNELLAGYGRLRVPLVDAGRYADAIAIDRKVVATMVSMVEADPRNTLLQRNLSVSYNSLARDLRLQGAHLAACLIRHARVLRVHHLVIGHLQPIPVVVVGVRFRGQPLIISRWSRLGRLQSCQLFPGCAVLLLRQHIGLRLSQRALRTRHGRLQAGQIRVHQRIERILRLL